MKKRSILVMLMLTLICVLGLKWQIDSFAVSASDKSERTMEFLYKFSVRDIPESSEEIRVWIPLPLSDRWQELRSFNVEGDLPNLTVIEPQYGNRFLLLDISEMGKKKGKIDVAVRYLVNRKSYSILPGNDKSQPPVKGNIDRFLAPDRLVPIDGRISEEALRVVGDEKDPLKQARLLYDHIVGSVAYDKSGKGWGRGDALFVCDTRTGNCTDFHSLFIGEARSLGIPARFVMGFPLPADAASGKIGGYHCWAEFYIDEHGWVPIDASEASKDLSKMEALFGGLDANRIAFTIGRDIHIPQVKTERPFNYVIYPHVEVDGKIHRKMDMKFTFRDIRS